MSTTASDQPSAPSRNAARHERLFGHLAGRFYTGVYNYLCWMSRDRTLAEELTQETFVQAWQHIEALRSEKAGRAWLYRIARNQFLQQGRRPQLPTVALEDCAERALPAPVATQPDRAAEREDLCRAVQKAVEALPESHREVIVLHNMEQLSLAQVAKVLDLPVGTVKSRRARAFSVLRRVLASEVDQDEMQSSTKAPCD
jgi:RNA polymerase sigma-70 factor (ECF subfamily)